VSIDASIDDVPYSIQVAVCIRDADSNFGKLATNSTSGPWSE